MCSDVTDFEARLECTRQCLDLLPPGNKAILLRLIRFLRLVTQNKDMTKMDATNLATVFAPTLLTPPNDKQNMSSLLGDSLHAHKLMETFINNFDNFKIL